MNVEVFVVTATKATHITVALLRNRLDDNLEESKRGTLRGWARPSCGPWSTACVWRSEMKSADGEQTKNRHGAVHHVDSKRLGEFRCLA